MPCLIECVDHVPDGVLVSGHSRAIVGTGVPDADAMMIMAGRTRIAGPLPRRTICCSP